MHDITDVSLMQYTPIDGNLNVFLGRQFDRKLYSMDNKQMCKYEPVHDSQIFFKQTWDIVDSTTKDQRRKTKDNLANLAKYLNYFLKKSTECEEHDKDNVLQVTQCK